MGLGDCRLLAAFVPGSDKTDSYECFLVPDADFEQLENKFNKHLVIFFILATFLRF